MKIQYYKTNCGTFFKSDDISSHSVRYYIINGIEGELLPKYNSFYLVKENELEVKIKKSAARKWNGWKLKNPALESSIFPLVLEQGKIVGDLDEDNEKSYLGDFGDYHPLYEQIYEDQPATVEPVEVTLVCLGELHIENLTKPEETKVKLVQGNFGGKEQLVDLSSIVTYEALTQMLVPDFMLHNHPCSLSSKQVYEIIRSYVKDTIKPSTAKITSDYDFCFSVSKIYATAKPINASKEVKKANGRSYSTPRFTTLKINTNAAQIFEMTHSGSGGKHSGYTAIEGWMADNLEDMKQQVKVYLESLMQVINAESKECSCCNGTGFVFETCTTK